MKTKTQQELNKQTLLLDEKKLSFILNKKLYQHLINQIDRYYMILLITGEAADASHDLQIEKASVDLAGLNRNVRTPEGAKDKKGNGKKNKATGRNNKRKRKGKMKHMCDNFFGKLTF